MKSHPASLDNRPFASLDKLLELKQIRLPEVHLPVPASQPLTPEEEQALFDAAMADVIPLDSRGRIAKRAPHRGQRPVRRAEHPDAEALRQLKRLVETGSGFIITHTAEYVEGACTWVPSEVFRRLHGGHFSIQGHVDLHGMNVATAQASFDRFMKRAILTGQRAVLVVHGRGRSSPGPPVLKRKLFDWLTRAPWKRWVIAFTSARACDGGTGATYVLLRKVPQSVKRGRPIRQQ
jgi:DNA-nicking Smr family endonuclease